jgi:hypothetical protein
MQTALFRENEVLAFAENKEAAENLVDHLQNWIDGVIPLIKEQREGFNTNGTTAPTSLRS